MRYLLEYNDELRLQAAKPIRCSVSTEITCSSGKNIKVLYFKPYLID